MSKHKLIEIDWPDFGICTPPPKATANEFQKRINKTLSAMKERKLTHLVIYADREHFANMAYLTGFDPRFEEALLILNPDKFPLLIVGNECEGYLTVSPLFNPRKLRHERFQPFSLLNQPRNNSRQLSKILASEGINKRSLVGCVGWKYFHSTEHPAGKYAIDIPSYIADTLRELTAHNKVTNETDIFMHPDYGLRTFASANEIAYFEYTNILASEGMRRMIFGMREGMIDYDVAKLAEYNGEPMGCHMTFVTGENRERGLSGPIGAKI